MDENSYTVILDASLLNEDTVIQFIRTGDHSSSEKVQKRVHNCEDISCQNKLHDSNVCATNYDFRSNDKLKTIGKENLYSVSPTNDNLESLENSSEIGTTQCDIYEDITHLNSSQVIKNSPVSNDGIVKLKCMKYKLTIIILLIVSVISIAAISIAIHQTKDGTKNKSGRCASHGEWLYSGHKANQPYQNLIVKVIKKNNAMDLQRYRHTSTLGAFCVVNKQILIVIQCNQTDELMFLEPDKDYIHVTVGTKNMQIHTCHQTHKNSVLLASKHGLYVLRLDQTIQYNSSKNSYSIVNTNAIYKKVLSRGITDMAYANNRVYILFSKDRILIYVFGNGKWKLDHSFRPSIDARLFNSIGVVNFTIYLSANMYNKIHKYTLTGQFIDKYGSVGDTLGLFREPFICGQDNQESVLICGINNKLQILSSSGNWSEYSMKESHSGQSRIVNVIVDTVGNMWVLWSYNSLQIITKYCAS